MIAGDHDHALDAHGLQAHQRLLGRLAWRVHQADRAELPIAQPHDHGRPALLAQRGDGRCRGGTQGGNPVRAEHLGLADPYRLIAQTGFDAAADQVFQVRGRWQLARIQSAATITRDRGGQRMIAQRLHRDRYLQQLGLRRPVNRHHIGDARAPFGQGAGLVEGHRLQRTQILQRRAALDQHAPTRRAGDTGQDRARGGDGQRARTGGHQHGHGAIEAVAERLIHHHPGKQQQERQRQYRRYEDPLEAIGEALGGRLACLGLAHHLHHPRQRGVLGALGHFHFDRTGPIDGACEDPTGRIDAVGPASCQRGIFHRPLVHRDGLAGHRCLVDAGVALQQESIGRQALVGTHQYPITELEVADRNLGGGLAADDDRRIRRELGQRLDGALGASHRVVLQRMTQAEKE